MATWVSSAMPLCNMGGGIRVGARLRGRKTAWEGVVAKGTGLAGRRGKLEGVREK